jgi:hypothetical protein
MEPATYVQRIALNFRQNMVPFPEELDIASEVLAGCQADRLRDGLLSLHRWMADVYSAAADSPESLGLPCHPDILPRSGSRYAASAQAFGAIPTLIFALGLCGSPVEHGGQVRLQVDQNNWAAYCRQAKIKKSQALLDALGKHGVEVVLDTEPGSELQIRFSVAPDIALALPAFVQACCAFSKKTSQAPLEFCRADMRVMQPVQSRKRSLPVTVADALRPLDDEQAGILAELDRLVESLGFRAECRCSGLNRGEWRGSYKSNKLGRTLFGYVVEEGQLTARIMIGETGRILPYLAQCPAPLRQAFYAAHTCQACGQCKVGPVRVSLDGESRRLCNYALFTVPDIGEESAAGMRILLEAQAGVLQETLACISTHAASARESVG